MIRNIFFSLCLVYLMPLVVKAQDLAVGGSVMYNFQTESYGAGARVSIFPARRISIVPQFSYYFGFNKIHEYCIGSAVEFKFIRTRVLNFYALAHAGYNRWINYEFSALSGAQPGNWNLEGGLGISTVRWIRPFIEYRYNIKFQETHLQLGLLYIFGQSRSNTYCPSFN